VRSFSADFIPQNVHFATRVIAYLDENPNAKQSFLETVNFAYGYTEGEDYGSANVLGEFSIAFKQFLCPDCADKDFTGVMLCVVNMLLEGRWF
jgi:hypothetical protein